AGIVLKPTNLSYEEAASVPNGALTALTFLHKMAKIQRGQKVLINGASGSMGSAAVQIAKSFGAEVTGVCSGANVEMVKALGADQVIDYTKEDFTQGSESYDIVFDTVGKMTFAACKRVLKPNGLYLAGAGGVPDFLQMLWTSLVGGKKLLAGMSSESKADLTVVKELVEAGKLKAVIDRCYALEDMAEAHHYVDKGHKKGNVVITVAQDSRTARTR
ncbi:MAG: NAD(P)-dependent alcohol dehydrogenase, partial [Anaerolineae bacterium]